MITENLSWDEPEKIPQEVEEQVQTLISKPNVDTKEKAAATRATVSFLVLDRLSSMVKDELEGNEKGQKVFDAFEKVAAGTMSALVNTLSEGHNANRRE